MRKKREIVRFAKWCFGYLNLPPIQIHYCPAKSLVDPNGGFCFGCYTWGENTREIFLSYRLSKFANMGDLAHEIWHYKQERDGRINSMKVDECEDEAEKAGLELVALWLIRGGKVTVK